MGIPPHALHDEGTLISWNRLGRLLELVAGQLDRPTFGLDWAFGMPPPFAGAGPVSLLAVQSRTVGEWLEKVMRYWQIHTDGHALQLIDNPKLPLAIAQGADASGHLIALRFHSSQLVLPGRQLMEYMLAGAVQIIRGMADVDDRLLVAARFRHLRPADPTMHDAAFRCRLDFGADHYQLVFERRLLDLPIVVPLGTLPDIFGAFLQYQMQRRPSYDQSMAATVALAIPSLLGTGTCTLEFVAEALGVSPKKLQRLLAQENTAFSEVYNTIRREMACRMLAETDAPLSAIAGLLDYASTVPFSNAFRRWTGLAPTAFRKRARMAGTSFAPLAPNWWRQISTPVERARQRRR